MNESNASSPTIYTIGHSNISDVVFLALLQHFAIQVLVDVRSSPYSQYSPQFNRETLEQTLKKAGIDYKYAGEFLGGRPKDPSCYKSGQMPEGKADYLQLVDYPKVMIKEWYKKGIQRLIDIACTTRVVVMCSEEDPAHCHRHHLIGKTLVEKGITVLHIRGDGLMVKDEQLPNLHDEPPAKQLSFL